MELVLNKIIEDYKNKILINKLWYIIPVSLNTDLAVKTTNGFLFDISNLVKSGIFYNQLFNIKKIRLYSFNLKNITPGITTAQYENNVYINLVNLNSDSFLNKNLSRYHFQFPFYPFYYVSQTVNNGQAYPTNFIYDEYIFTSKITTITELNIELYFRELTGFISNESVYISTNGNGIILQFDFYCLP